MSSAYEQLLCHQGPEWFSLLLLLTHYEIVDEFTATKIGPYAGPLLQ